MHVSNIGEYLLFSKIQILRKNENLGISGRIGYNYNYDWTDSSLAVADLSSTDYPFYSLSVNRLPSLSAT